MNSDFQNFYVFPSEGSLLSATCAGIERCRALRTRTAAGRLPTNGVCSDLICGEGRGKEASLL